MKCSLQMFPLPEPERSRDREQGNIEGKSEKWGALHFLPSFLYQKSVSVFSFFCHLSYFRVSCSSAFTSFASGRMKRIFTLIELLIMTRRKAEGELSDESVDLCTSEQREG